MIKRTPAYLVLDDGRIFEGLSWAKTGETFGEAVFSTGMTGYQETLTDPSYHQQVVIMTAPHIGNTGMNKTDEESLKTLDNFCSSSSTVSIFIYLKPKQSAISEKSGTVTPFEGSVPIVLVLNKSFCLRLMIE